MRATESSAAAQIGPQVLDVLDPDGQPQQSVRHLGTLLGPATATFQGRLDPAQARDVDPEARGVGHGLGCFGPTVQLEADDRPEGGHLRGCQTVPWVLGKAQVPYPRDGRVPGAPSGDLRGVGAGALPPQREGAQPTQGDPRLHGPGDAAAEHPVAGDALDEVGVAGDDDSEQDVGVPGQVLGGAVHDDVGPEVQRLLAQGGGEGGVHDDERTGLVGGRRDRRDVHDLQRRVGRGLQPDQGRAHGRPPTSASVRAATSRSWIRPDSFHRASWVRVPL